MEITDIKIFPVNEKRVKAYASIVFDDCFIIRDLKIIHGENKLFVAMPSKKMKDGSYRDTVHPLNNETRQKIEANVLEAYEKELSKAAKEKE
ncbi:MAG TPA: septation regulator SpoVG [Syntrophorhabdaceae bacterium]|mgnify:CR=1 FL=1|nr:septation regulator SpoVG [Syntrophorhabdaceae bacterium]HOL05787.1 septation regulator SpoVG [Syntrophorhabdaceae bacterium]HON86143.1 septation regulator SpoVG [Syntrophorhabdaceae bacterium]HOT42949.1 septation regulator SpoVG [Syntrophorhabdaceae bacterium]HPC66800.1 septation regulator SpoVG [Syntrophorhabdaceae bacterium]